jgi:hypothetical protein
MNTAQGTGSTLPTISTESEGEREPDDLRQHSNDSTNSDCPFPPSPVVSSPAKLTPTESHSPKQLIQKKASNRPSVTSLAPQPSASPSSPSPPAIDEATNSDTARESESFNPINVSVSAFAFEPSADESERPSDVYSLNSDGIPEHDEEEENKNDEELLNGGDGSKPVGCTACAIQ